MNELKKFIVEIRPDGMDGPKASFEIIPKNALGESCVALFPKNSLSESCLALYPKSNKK
jgi:hypothetical protein